MLVRGERFFVSAKEVFGILAVERSRFRTELLVLCQSQQRTH